MQMTKKKKILVLSLALLLVLAVVLTVVFVTRSPKGSEDDQTSQTGQTEDIPIRGELPADKPALVVKGTKACAGDTQVEVTINVVNNPGILGMDFDLYYDDTVMTLVEAQSLLDLEGCEYTPSAYFKNPTTFLWDFQDASWTQDGAVLKLYFDIAEDAPAGKYEIKIMYSYGNIFDANFEPIDFGVKNGNISIS